MLTFCSKENLRPTIYLDTPWKSYIAGSILRLDASDGVQITHCWPRQETVGSSALRGQLRSANEARAAGNLENNDTVSSPYSLAHISNHLTPNLTPATSD
jgi:hypothetical protein